MSMAKNLIFILIGIATGAATMFWLPLNFGADSTAASSDEAKPMYWVAPMDPNYRRDGPGKSPMGMDLIPVYAEEQGSDDSPGTISISPEVVNNLGVRTVQIRQGALAPKVRTVGYLQYNQDRIVHIHPRVDGWIERSFVNSSGEVIEKGQPLYDLYSPALVNAQEELLFGLQRGDQRLIAAAEQRLRALQVADSFIRQLKQQRRVSQSIRFYAPETGVVDELNLREGFYVQPGMTLLSLANLDEIWVEAEVFERQASLIRAGLPVELSLDFLPGQTRKGTVDYVYPSLDSKTRTLRIRVRLDNPDHLLKPNMFAELHIDVGDNQQRLLVPKEAVIRGAQQDRLVLALGNGRFKSVAVRLGAQDVQYAEVLKGVNPGESVVASAQFLLDSESSKTSDFKRMNEAEETLSKVSEKPAQVWVAATINTVNAEKRKINVDHAAIEAWQWPRMTMDFNLDPFVEMDELTPGLEAHLQITRTPEKKFFITDVHIPEAGEMSNASMAEGMADMKPAAPTAEKPTPPGKVWVNASVNSIDTSGMKLNAQHKPVPEWNWPGMVMDFNVAAWVELDEIPTGTALHLEISKTDSGYEITDFYQPEAK